MIYGEQIYLRGIVKEDIDVLYDICVNKEVLKYNGGQGDIPSKDYIKKQFNHFGRPNRRELAIVNNESEVIGFVYFKENRFTRGVFSIGITIGIDYWWQGYGGDSIRTLCKYLFYKKRAHKIELEVVKENIGAIECYKKCGFIEEGIRRSKYYLSGVYLDTMIMGLLKKEFISK